MLRYGGVSTDEQEVVIRLDAQDGHAHVSSTWPTWSRKFEKLHGTPPKYQERGGFVTVAFWTLPINTVSVRKRAKRVLTAEQAQAIGDRLRNARLSPPASYTQAISARKIPAPYPTASEVVSGAKVPVR